MEETMIGVLLGLMILAAAGSYFLILMGQQP